MSFLHCVLRREFVSFLTRQEYSRRGKRGGIWFGILLANKTNEPPHSHQPTLTTYIDSPRYTGERGNGYSGHCNVSTE